MSEKASPRPLRVALLQLNPQGRNRDANLESGLAACREAAELGADIAVFPEMWSIGYDDFDSHSETDRAAWVGLAVRRDDAFVTAFGALAHELRMAICITYLEAWDGGPRNAATLFDRTGNEVLHYAKVHLCTWDTPESACTPGGAFPVATLGTAVGPVEVGLMICFDRELPETARALMLGGAELILTPNACDLDDRAAGLGDVRIAQFRARAFENLLAVAMANYAAPRNDGHSVAFHPDGSTVVQAGEQAGIVMADVDLERVRAFRRAEAIRDAARRPELYGSISSTATPGPLAERKVRGTTA